MAVAEDVIRRVMRLIVVLICATGASWGFAAGAHATTHSLTGAASPSHHHSSGGHAPHAIDDGTQARPSRRAKTAVVRKVLEPVLAAWTALRSVVGQLTPPALIPHVWTPRLSLASSPEQLCVHRT